MSFNSCEFDRCILGEVFKVVEAPSMDLLKSALEASRCKKKTRLSWIRSERERLTHEERLAQERAELTHGSLRRVHLDALERLEKVLEEKERFEQRIAIEPLPTVNEASEDELEELCRVASDVPRLWDHPAMTHEERKAILRCVIDHIVVAATRDRIDATIYWKGGEQTQLSIWRLNGRDNLIRELHTQKLTGLEIKEHLAAGRTSTGQVVKISLARVYFNCESWVLNRIDSQPVISHYRRRRLSFIERVGLLSGLLNTSTNRDYRAHRENRGRLAWSTI